MARLDELIAEAADDPDTIGLLLHGSRARGTDRPDSDYDLIRVLTDPAWQERKDRNDLHVQGDGVDTAYTNLARLEWHAENLGWNTPALLTARVLLDESGEVAKRLDAIAEAATARAWADLPEAYDDYLNCFVRSVRAWRRGDTLGGRLHAAQSALVLVRVLFGAERRWPPFLDGLEPELPALEAAQGWPEGYLRPALLTLLHAGDVETQIELEDRIEALLRSRGVEHEWGDELEQLKQG